MSRLSPSALDPGRAPLVPPKGDPRRAALRSLGFETKLDAITDKQALDVICRWMEQDDPRFEAYYDRFVEPSEPITRERIRVSPARYRRIVSWQQHPLYGLVPYEAIFDGGDPEEIDDNDVREQAPLTIKQMAERIAQHFDMPEHTAKLSAVLARVWRAERTDQPLSVVAAITGVAPVDTAGSIES